MKGASIQMIPGMASKDAKRGAGMAVQGIVYDEAKALYHRKEHRLKSDLSR